MTNIPEIPHGHGLSFKKGISDGILEENTFESSLPSGGHLFSYKKGYELGKLLKNEVARKVKPNHIEQ
ncbi:hypothetical protein J9253_09250 [Thiothrix litoralis]|jgi:hypothetical protein|uniref:Uncharacterized protein n=1 Tax=Thiothrix litoralis TaxID=2891210 RepID=A0ABX7WYH1_9GAMM|nr:hypothetical protein [Thiothrix litoralis]QTR48077.1 hypothetical protein J9253_09250 [Thiothrix litoralis]